MMIFRHEQLDLVIAVQMFERGLSLGQDVQFYNLYNLQGSFVVLGGFLLLQSAITFVD